MKRSTIHKQSVLRLAGLIALVMMVGGTVFAQVEKPIKHKAGQTSLIGNGYGKSIQKTATQTSIVYAIPGGATRTLKLPPQRDGSATPTACYTRWYDYTTDAYPTGLTLSATPNYKFTSGAVYINNTNKGFQQATIALKIGEKSRVIACDVAGYKDHDNINIDNTRAYTEPTLSYRSIFEIKDAHIMADLLKECTGDKYLEDKTIYMPAAPNLGLEYPKATLEYDDENYFGYCGANIINTDMGEDQTKTSESTTKWDVSSTRKRTRTLTQNYTSSNRASITTENIASKSGRFCFIAPGSANSEKTALVKWNCSTRTYTKTWTETQRRNSQWDNWGNSTLSNERTINDVTTSFTYNLARFKIKYVDQPKQYTMGAKNTRSIKYLNENYVLLASETFDYDTYVATAKNNCYTKSLEDCSYGFVYPQLYNDRWKHNCVSQWNEYGFYKTACVQNISGDDKTVDGHYYDWYNNGNPVYDRNYYDSEKKQNGYFMYIDASNMPGTVAKLKFDTPLCIGTKLIVSAGVCNFVNADNTDGDVNFVFKGVTADGTEVELNRYTSGNIPKVLNNSSDYGGMNGKEWYQAYYDFTIDSDINYKYYLVQIENNASNTAGGDYAVDDIRVYRSKPGVEAVQLELPCGEDIPKVKVKIGFDKLVEAMGSGSNPGEHILCYRFLDENQNVLDYDYGNEKEYGEIKYSTIFENNNDDVPIASADVLAGKETSSVSGEEVKYLVFQTPNNASLKTRQYYYIGIANDEKGTFDTGICGLVSLKFRIEPPSYITVDSAPDIDTSGLCFGKPMTVGATLKDRITMEVLKGDYRFDWYMGAPENFEKVKDALDQYRLKDPTPEVGENTLKSVDNDASYTKEMEVLLRKEMEAGNLVLNKKELTLSVQKDDDIRAMVIAGTITDTNATVCLDVIKFITSAPGKTPVIVLGTQYGESKTATIRMSLAQFNAIKGGAALRIPIYDFFDSNNTKDKTLSIIDGDNDITLIGTSDKHATDSSVKIGKLTSITQNARYLEINMAQDGNGDTLKANEGYYYRMLFYFQEVTAAGTAGDKETENICNGSVQFNIKIVPEHLTWTGEYNDNWNNDANWKRSTREELYETTYDDGDTERQGYVPLDFTKVTVANTATAPSPWLYNVEGEKGTCMQNLTNSNDANSTATTYIESDMVAQTKDTDGFYTCINFYANTCDQVYFKPQAEMRNTHDLIYNKAWADFELTSGRWYMLSTPLQGVVAGDMYLPTANGRQETPAFNDITFDLDKNNRFNPAVYQRSWDHASPIIFKQEDKTEDAFIAANWSNVYNKVDEAYEPGKGFSIRPLADKVNKVLFRLPKADTSYSYYAYNGSETAFSGNSTNITRSNAGRLNDYDTTDGEISVDITNSSDNSNYFLAGNPYMATLDMKKFFDANTGLEKKFWIITENGQAAAVFNADGTITATDGTVSATIAPMQSFFVQKTATRSTESGDIKFTPDMTIARPAAGTLLKARTRASEEGHKRLYISAEREGKRSNILIEQRSDATDGFNAREDVEALMDSNLGDSPILYSVAGNQALAINLMESGIETIPLGIYSNKNEEVTLTVTGAENFGNSLELYDALLNESMPIDNSHTTFSIPGNTHGRYFLTTTSPDGDTDNSINIYSPEKNKVLVTASISDKLQRIRVYNVNGMLVKELGNLDSISEEFTLAPGLYIIHAEGQESDATGKVNCRN